MVHHVHGAVVISFSINHQKCVHCNVYQVAFVKRDTIVQILVYASNQKNVVSVKMNITTNVVQQIVQEHAIPMLVILQLDVLQVVSVIKVMFVVIIIQIVPVLNMNNNKFSFSLFK